jgi:hypothetical protein
LQVWRLLAETQMLQGDAAAAAATYETANSKAGGGSIELLSAWTDALVAANKPQKVPNNSLAALLVARCPVVSVCSWQADVLALRAYETTSERSVMQAVEVVRAAKQKADSAELAVDLVLLQGRVLSAWRGHNGEALALYDQLAEVRLPQRSPAVLHIRLAAKPLLASAEVITCIWNDSSDFAALLSSHASVLQANPTDFRPVLAKALVLKRCSRWLHSGMLQVCCTPMFSVCWPCEYLLQRG